MATLAAISNPTDILKSHLQGSTPVGSPSPALIRCVHVLTRLSDVLRRLIAWSVSRFPDREKKSFPDDLQSEQRIEKFDDFQSFRHRRPFRWIPSATKK